MKRGLSLGLNTISHSLSVCRRSPLSAIALFIFHFLSFRGRWRFRNVNLISCQFRIRVLNNGYEKLIHNLPLDYIYERFKLISLWTFAFFFLFSIKHIPRTDKLEVEILPPHIIGKKKKSQNCFLTNYTNKIFVHGRNATTVSPL